jgi:hypothetical protein
MTALTKRATDRGATILQQRAATEYLEMGQ